MGKTALQQYCLAQMGITQYKRRALLGDYLICLIVEQHDKPPAILSTEQKQLLDRMCLALHWPLESIQTVFLEGEDEKIAMLFWQRITEYQPKKVLLFGNNEGKIFFPSTENPVSVHEDDNTLCIALLPALSTLLNDPIAKRAAWKIMQSLILPI